MILCSEMAYIDIRFLFFLVSMERKATLEINADKKFIRGLK